MVEKFWTQNFLYTDKNIHKRSFNIAIFMDFKKPLLPVKSLIFSFTIVVNHSISNFLFGTFKLNKKTFFNFASIILIFQIRFISQKHYFSKILTANRWVTYIKLPHHPKEPKCPRSLPMGRTAHVGNQCCRDYYLF